MNNDKLANAFGKVAWAYVFLYMDVTLLVVNVLPKWVGFLLILSAFPVLSEHVPAMTLLRPLGLILALWHGLNWGLDIFGGSIEVYILDVLEAILALYFFFQLLTNLAEILQQLELTEAKKILTLPTVQAVLITCTALVIPLISSQWITMTLGGIHLVVVLWVCALLFGIKKKLEHSSQPMEE